MDYSQLSDQEINMKVAFALGCKEVVPGIFMSDDRRYEFDRPKNKAEYKFYFDPCNNVTDAWPIIDKYRISIINLGEDEWGARGVADCKSKRAIHENSLRAAMIVFLMMQDAKHA